MKKRFLLAFVTLMVGVMAMWGRDMNIVKFNETRHDFGYIKESDGPVSHTFEFVNTGNVPIVITRATASCGCTKPEYPTKPIKPGKKAKIKVTFNPSGRKGAFTKHIKVYTTANEKRAVLVITGTIVSSKKDK